MNQIARGAALFCLGLCLVLGGSNFVMPNSSSRRSGVSGVTMVRAKPSKPMIRELRSVGFGTVRAANNAVLLLVAITVLVLKKSAISAWAGFGLHALVTGIMGRFPCPIKIPESFRRDARSNLAKSYIAQVILLTLALTSQSPTSALVSRYLLFALIFVTSIFFDWPNPPLLEAAPALVFPGAIPTKSEADSGDDRSSSSKFIMRLVGILLLTKLLSSQTRQSALSWGAAFFAHCVVIYLSATRSKRRKP